LTKYLSDLRTSNSSKFLKLGASGRYVVVILQLIEKAGDFVSDDIWYRVVQFVTNNEDLQVSLTCDSFTVEIGQKPSTPVALQTCCIGFFLSGFSHGLVTCPPA
jgi:AP-2 complex subunit alpha